MSYSRTFYHPTFDFVCAAQSLLGFPFFEAVLIQKSHKMSGGFFRGTSAEQDTRFSNKHAKLLKSQKFAPELDHLADMTKIKMDVMRPWIAKRATEFLGFEDEVLINFIYGLLEGKNVNGKEIQISLTGFMEKNTAKFMKELWSLLISAQNNASGVPQQFLDAKVEETRKKKAESDKIANEIQKKCEKENRDVDQVRPKKMAYDFDISRDAVAAALAPSSRPVISNTFPVSTDDARDITQRNGFNRRNSERKKSPSQSVSPEVHKHLISSGECDTPQRRYRAPHRQFAREPTSSSRFISRHSTQHFQLCSDHNSPSPYMARNKHSPSQRRPSSRIRYRHPRSKSNTPVRRRSPSNSSVNHDSRSPYWRGSSPMLHMSPSHTRHGSPMCRDSPSPPIHCRSPSPIRPRSQSPISHRSLSPIYHRSPFPTRHRVSSPVHQRFSFRQRSPSIRRKRLSQVHHRSPYPSRHRSSSPYSCGSPSPIKYKQRYRYRSPKRHSSPSRRHINPSVSPRGISRSPVSQNVYMHEHRGSPSSCPRRSRSLDRLRPSPVERAMDHEKSPLLQEISLCFDHDNVEEDDPVPINRNCKIGTPRSHPSLKSPQKDIEHSYKENTLSYISPDRSSKMIEGNTRQRELTGCGDTAKTLPIKSLEVHKDLISSSMHKESKSNYSYHDPSCRREDIIKENDFETKRRQCSDEMVESSRHLKYGVEKCGMRSWESDCAETGVLREAERGRKRHNKKRVRKSSSGEDSEEGKVAAKRGRRAVRKEERRRRREERRRRKEEKRVEKQGRKSTREKRGSDEDVHKQDKDDCEEKRLEDELRKKAIESLRAKKGIYC